MEEKERYEWSQDFNPECPYDEFEYIVDSETGKVLDNFEIKDLLNKLEINLNKEIESNCELYNKQLENEQEIQQLKQSQKQLAISELKKIT